MDFNDPFAPQLLGSMRFWRVRFVVYPTSGKDSAATATKRFATFVDDLNRIVRLYKVRRGKGRTWPGTRKGAARRGRG